MDGSDGKRPVRRLLEFCRAHRVGRKLVVCTVLALFLFGGQIACWSDENNRLERAWKLTNSLAMILDVLALGMTLTLAAVLLGAWKRRMAASLGRFALLLLLAFGLVGTLSACFDASDGTITHAGGKACSWPVTLAWLAAVPLLFVLRERLARPATVLCLILSPLVPILFVQMLGWSTFGRNPVAADLSAALGTAAPQRAVPGNRGGDGSSRPAERRTSADVSPVYVFLFDEWSFVRCVRGRQFCEYLPNLRKLSGQSIVFSQARSPGLSTDVSVPRLLYQSEGELRVVGARACWVSGGRSRPAESVPTLLDAAAKRGRRTVIVGSFLETFYSTVGERVDWYAGPGAVAPARSMPGMAAAQAQALLREMAATAIRNGRYGNDPLSLWLEYEARSAKCSWLAYRSTRRMRDVVFEVLDRSPDNTFAFFHWPFPHGPFVFNPDGSFHAVAPAGDEGLTLEGYERHLRYLDRLVGEITDRLRAAGKFDRATIVLTSDHSWRHEPDPVLREQSAGNYRVPLIVKLAGQTQAVWVDEPLETMRIQPLLELAMRGKPDLPQALATIRGLSRGPGQPDGGLARRTTESHNLRR